MPRIPWQARYTANSQHLSSPRSCSGSHITHGSMPDQSHTMAATTPTATQQASATLPLQSPWLSLPNLKTISSTVELAGNKQSRKIHGLHLHSHCAMTRSMKGGARLLPRNRQASFADISHPGSTRTCEDDKFHRGNSRQHPISANPRHATTPGLTVRHCHITQGRVRSFVRQTRTTSPCQQPRLALPIQKRKSSTVEPRQYHWSIVQRPAPGHGRFTVNALLLLREPKPALLCGNAVVPCFAGTLEKTLLRQRLKRSVRWRVHEQGGSIPTSIRAALTRTRIKGKSNAYELHTECVDLMGCLICLDRTIRLKRLC